MEHRNDKRHDKMLESQSSQHGSIELLAPASGSSMTSSTAGPSIGFGDLPHQLKSRSKDDSYFSQLYSKPMVTTLNSFSQVANLVRNPYELINNVDEFVKHHSTRYIHHPTPNESGRESTELGGSSRDSDSETTKSCEQQHNNNDNNGKSAAMRSAGRITMVPLSERRLPDNPIPPPSLPRIECSNKRSRLAPLTVEEYVETLQDEVSNDELIARIFRGSMSSNLLRQVLWPIILDIVDHRDRIEFDADQDQYVIKPDERNGPKWAELEAKYKIYNEQWKSILPEQELRFSAYRDRKSMIERDVVRCDRKHKFYADDHGNLDVLNEMLMTYMMYDFDIGYVQGMSDLAAPILYVYEGDVVRSFWTFVSVMRLFRRNFELSQKTIHFQLLCLYRLIKITDPCFAQYLRAHDSSNCFFAFRCIVCQFKRELMKEDEQDYNKVLFLWDTIWCVQSLHNRNQSQESQSGDIITHNGGKENDIKDDDDKPKESSNSHVANGSNELIQQANAKSSSKESSPGASDTSPVKSTTPPDLKFQQCFYASFDPNQADIPRYELTETEKFVLALCLSLIRRERDAIMAHNLDSTEILQHFINPRLGDDLGNFIEHATNIYSYLNIDFDINRLLSDELIELETTSAAQSTNDDGYDLLNDYLVINAASSV